MPTTPGITDVRGVDSYNQTESEVSNYANEPEPEDTTLTAELVKELILDLGQIQKNKVAPKYDFDSNELQDLKSQLK